MRLLRWLSHLIFGIVRTILWPLQRGARRRLMRKSGWAELMIGGTVYAHRPRDRFPLPPFLKRFLRQPDEPRVVLSRLHRFVDAFSKDRFAKGVLVKLHALGGGWVDAIQIRSELDRLREAGKTVLVHVATAADNREYMIAAGGSRVLMTPNGPFAAVGAAGSTLFLKDALSKAGVRFEVAARGRYKSAPDQFIRNSRSATDLEQTKALVDEVDAELVRSIAAGREIPVEDVKGILDRAPMIGLEAKTHKLCDDVAHDEDLSEEIMSLEGLKKAPKLLGAGWYLNMTEVRPPWKRRKKLIGVVEVHGAIVDSGSPYLTYVDRLAVQQAVVNDLRAALEDPGIGAVVLHVDSRGGSVTASDAIWSAVKRLDREKPVIACMNNVAASGGYYVACGARSIVCSPLTVTGSIGVYAMYPVWPELAKMIGVNHDVVKNRLHAALFDPWREISEDVRAHSDREVAAMYDAFISLVAEARGKTKEEIDAIAQGRVWSGRAAKDLGLVDGLGGMEEALERVREAAHGVAFEDEPVLVRSWRNHPRPPPPDPDASKSSAIAPLLGAMLRRAPLGRIAEEIVLLSLTAPSSALPIFAYAPFELS